jgi:EmrB/QacA subfamily drug resistance transporter
MTHAKPVPVKTAQEKSNQFFLWIVAIGFFMETLDSTIVNTALPAMAESLHESPLSMHSVIIAYSLSLAILIPATGWFADKIGIRRVFLLAITIFTLGSLLCALSPTLHLLVAARVLQGIGGSMLMPIGRLAILRLFPHEQYLAAMSLVAVPALIGPLIGPMLGGFLVQIANWHWIFLINIPVGIIGFICTTKFMPEIPSFEVARFDLKGFLLLGLGMVSISLALDGISELGLQQVTVTLLFLLGFAGLMSYVFHAARNRAPIFSLELFKVRTFAVGLVGNLFARIGSASMPFLIPLFLQVSLGYSPFQSGLTMFPIAFAAIFSRRLAPPLIHRYGYRKFLLVNTMLVGISIISFLFISKQEPDWLRVVQLVIFGGANSLQYSAMNSLTLKDLETKGTSSGNSLFSMIQMLAMSFGVATAGALLTSFHEKISAQGGSLLQSFHMTFLCMGAITCLSTLIFSQLSRENRKVVEVTPQVPE